MSYFHREQLGAEVPRLTEALEAIEHFSQFAPDTQTAAIELFCQEQRISKAKFAHLSRLWRGEA